MQGIQKVDEKDNYQTTRTYNIKVSTGMEVRLLLLPFLLRGVTLFCAVNGDNMTEENIRDTQAVTPRPTTMQNITTLQCENCPKNTKHPTTHHTTVLPTDNTTQGPSPPPSPIEYVLVGISGEVCLRIKAVFIIMLNTTEIRNITIPSPPITVASGYCFDGGAWLILKFPEGVIDLTFIVDKMDSVFYLEEVLIDLEEVSPFLASTWSKALITPLGHLYTHKEKKLWVSSGVSIVFLDVKVQAFEPDEVNFRRGNRPRIGYVDNTPTFGYIGNKPRIRCIDNEFSFGHIDYIPGSRYIDGESTFIILDKDYWFGSCGDYTVDDDDYDIFPYQYELYDEIIQILGSSSTHWIVTGLVPSIYIVVFLVALPLNIMAIVIFLVKVKVRKPAVVYMLNLAATDVLLISILPFYIVYRFLGSNWVIGEVMCRFVTAAFYCNMYCSILLMTSISVDRFLAVIYPVRSLPWRTVTRAWLVCGVIWVISLASTVPLLIRQQTQTYDTIDENIKCHDVHHLTAYLDFSVTYFSTVISLLFFLPLFITTFCYIGTIRSLSRSQSDATHKKSRVIRLTVVVLSVFVLCFGPTNVISLIHYVRMFNNNGSLYVPYILCVSISSINCCLDPLIYYFASSDYQRCVYNLLCCKKDYRPPVKQKSILKHKEWQPERGAEGENQKETKTTRAEPDNFRYKSSADCSTEVGLTGFS